MQAIINNTVAQELELLRTNKGDICISVIVPTHRLPQNHKTDESTIKKSAQQAIDLLQMKYPKQSAELAKSLSNLIERIDFTHNQEGIGLFVSNGMQLTVHFPFPVNPKTVVGKHFEIQDLLYKSSYLTPYYILHLEEKKASLYKGSFDHIEPIQDQNFPSELVADYEYSPPSRGSSYIGHAHQKSFEKDNAENSKVHYQSFLRKVDDLLQNYLTQESIIILVGPERNTATFVHQSRYANNIVDIIPGNYSKFNTKELADLIVPVIKSYQSKKMNEEVIKLAEKQNQNMIVVDQQDIKEAIATGKGLELVLERDFPFLTTENTISGMPEVDAVEEAIELMLEQNGQVVIVEPGFLKEYGHMALITRY